MPPNTSQTHQMRPEQKKKRARDQEAGASLAKALATKLSSSHFIFILFLFPRNDLNFFAWFCASAVCHRTMHRNVSHIKLYRHRSSTAAVAAPRPQFIYFCQTTSFYHFTVFILFFCLRPNRHQPGSKWNSFFAFVRLLFSTHCAVRRSQPTEQRFHFFAPFLYVPRAKSSFSRRNNE